MYWIVRCGTDYLRSVYQHELGGHENSIVRRNGIAVSGGSRIWVRAIQ
jgi:hypothetical protein